MKASTKIILILFSISIIFIDVDTSFAEIKTSGILDSIIDKYKSSAQSWGTIIQERATWLFVTLAAISMVWQFAQLLFKGSSISELFGEMIRYIVFTGFFLWLLRNGPAMASNLIDSMKMLGEKASGVTNAVSPSSIMDIGFAVFDKTLKGFSSWDLDVSIVNAMIAVVVLVVLALIAINMLLLLCSGWVLAYAGIFFLGFGGSKWTSDMAINYFKTCLGLGISIMTMVLLVGVGTGIINECYQNMSATTKTQELGVLLVTAITLFLLVDKLPAMVSGIITGASIGSMGIGAFGAGAAIGATMTGASIASTVHSNTTAPIFGAIGNRAANNLKGNYGNSTGGNSGNSGGGSNLSKSMGVKLPGA